MPLYKAPPGLTFMTKTISNESQINPLCPTHLFAERAGQRGPQATARVILQVLRGQREANQTERLKGDRKGPRPPPLYPRLYYGHGPASQGRS